MDFMQIFTLITGVVYIVLEIRQKNFMWVVGIATSLAAMWVFFRQGLYASFGLNTYYFITAFIGLWQWRRARNSLSSSQEDRPCDDAIVLNRLTLRTVLASALASAAGIFVLFNTYKLVLFINPLLYVPAFSVTLSCKLFVCM